MIAKAIDRILELGVPTTVRVNEENYSTRSLYRISREQRAEPITTTSLTSLIEYIQNFHEALKPIPYLVHVVSPTQVNLVSALDSDREREILMWVKAEVPRFAFGEFVDNEAFMIAVQSKFADDKNTDKDLILKFAGTVTNGSVKEYGDDGVTQKATIRQGVASKTEAIVPSPCVLRPFRTFTEVEQPASPFIFRMKDQGENSVCSALFEADGGAWKNEARKNICMYLTERLKGSDVTVIW